MHITRVLLAVVYCLGLIATGAAAQQTSTAPGKPPAPATGAAADDARADTNAHRTSLRFLTTTDFPPFNYADEDGQLTGFNIDFARAVCVELEVSCEIKAVAFDDLLPALDHGDGDAAVGALAVTPNTVAEADFSRRYYFMTAHFAVRKNASKFDISATGLESRKIAVLAGSGHEAYLKTYFPDSQILSQPTPEAVRDALVKGEVDAIFGDGLALAFWTNGTSSSGCCELVGKAYSDERYFGEGVAIAMRKGDVALARQINSAIGRVMASRRYEDMLGRYFPVRLF